MTETKTDVLDISTAVRLSTLIEACQRGARVTWAVDGDVSRVVEGVARAFTDSRSNFICNDTDIRDAHVWISATFEHFLPVRDVLDLMSQDLFVVKVG